MPGDELEKWIEEVCEADPLPADMEDEIDPAGPPLTAEEIETAHVRLAKWQSVEAFSEEVTVLCNRCISSDYFLQPRLKFLHDAYVLAKFARKCDVDQVCLAPHSETWPDGFVKTRGRTFNIEVTSTHGGRKLGDEYRNMKGWQFDPVDNWVARADSIPKYLGEAISGKATKKYGSPCWLVVYLNIDEWGIRQEQIEQVIADTISRHRNQFEGISVLWKGKLY